MVDEVLVQLKEKTKVERGPVLNEDAYEAKVVSVGLDEVPSFKNPSEKVNKIIFGFTIQGKPYPYFCSPKITLGGNGYSHSKLYELLRLSGDLDAVSSEESFSLNSLRDWLEARLVGRFAKVIVGTVNKGKLNEDGSSKEYSVVKSVVRFSPKTPGSNKKT